MNLSTQRYPSDPAAYEHSAISVVHVAAIVFLLVLAAVIALSSVQGLALVSALSWPISMAVLVWFEREKPADIPEVFREVPDGAC